MNPKKVSTIVPIFNQETILNECLDCLVHQTLTDIEILLVNDASTDNSLQVMCKYREHFPNLIRIIISPDNLGPGGTRNLGIAASTGKYVGFVDSDDLIQPNMYELLYHTAEITGYDVIDCGYYNESSDLAILHTPDSCCEVLNDMQRSELIVSGEYIFSKLYRRTLFSDPKLSFRENAILEDSDFISYLYATISSIGTVKEILYIYRNIPASASKMLQTHKYYSNIYDAMLHIYQKLYTLPNYKSIYSAVEYELLQMYSYGINICLRAYKNDEGLNVIELLEKLACLKKRIITGTYDNIYVQEKIAPMDIAIMQLNDSSSYELLHAVCIQK